MAESTLSSTRRIPARSRRQTMDWSLVLASQGIEHVIDHSEATGWALIIAGRDHEPALAHIHQYRLENRHWRWRQPLFRPGLFFDCRSAAPVVLMIGFFWWSEWRTDLRSLGMVDGVALGRGEWWRLFTATWLHADLAHLAMNSVFGLVLLGLVMGRYGAGTGLLSAYLAGATGNVATWLANGETHRGLGASGVVMGALGLVTCQSFVRPNSKNPNAFKRFSGPIMGGLLLFVFLGLNPETDVVAHLGGFAAGILFGWLLALAPPITHGHRFNLAAGISFAALVILPWLLALTRAK